MTLRLALTGCFALLSCGPALPAGLTCTKVISAAPGLVALRAALARAGSGSCVVAAPGTYDGAVRVPAGVSLVAAVGTLVVLRGEVTEQAAVTLEPGAGLYQVKVSNAPAMGVLIERGPATVVEVTVEAAASIGVVAWCEEDCSGDPFSSLKAVEVTQSALGLWTRGVPLRVNGGRIADSGGVALISGYGVVASHGAALQMDATRVEHNQNVGVLVDGDLGTTAALTALTVGDNHGRGVWAQGLVGTVDAPALRLTDCVLEGNWLAGLGARSSRGLVVSGGRVAGTVLAPAPTAQGPTTQVGDGIGLFADTGAVLIDAVALESNERSQVLVDLGAAGVTVRGGTLVASGAQLGVVVQHTTSAVDAPNVLVPAAGSELAVSAPVLSVPSR